MWLRLILPFRDRDRVDGEQRDDAAADVGECPEALEVRHPRGYHIARFQGGNIVLKAETLRFFTREQGVFPTVAVGAEIGDGKADGTVDA